MQSPMNTLQQPLGPPLAKELNPTRLNKPSFLMNFPFSYSTDHANNIWMRELDSEERKVNSKKAMREWLQLYQFLASDSLVFLLPAPDGCGLQDLVFTANLGIVPEHVPEKNVAIISNYSTEPRVGETPVGKQFFESLRYDTFVCPFKFEGEADLKHLYDNVYLGGYGTRSERAAYDWMEEKFDMKIVKLEEVDEYFYHLDCTVFPIDRETTLMCTELYVEEEIKEVEKYTDIVDVTADQCMSGICNSVRLSNTILNASNIHDLRVGTQEYADEVAKNRRLEDIAGERGFEVSYFNLSEYLKGGALLSCLIMHLNRRSYDFRLI